ncbi:hypothetical protein VP01_10536g1, partial [Puccinia sorghi]
AIEVEERINQEKRRQITEQITRRRSREFNKTDDKYKKVHTKSISTGFVLTNDDQKARISTIHDKLESMCPHYHEMNELMG